MSPNNFNTRECARIRGQLDAYMSNELLVETTGELLKHLEGCPACSRELDSRIRVREALRKAAEKQLPPESLRRTIHQRLMGAQPRTFADFHLKDWAIALASLAVLFTAIAAGQEWLKIRQGKELVAAILRLGVADHLECAIKGHNYPDVANPPALLRQKLGPEYTGLLPVVEKKLPNFQVLEAHVCHLQGNPRPYIHFIARGQGTILSVVLTPRQGESLPSGRFLATRASGGMDLYKAHLDGFNVAGFEWSGYFGFVVSSLDVDRTVQVAASLAPALRHTLGAGSHAHRPKAAAFLSPSGFINPRLLDDSGSQVWEEEL